MDGIGGAQPHRSGEGAEKMLPGDVNELDPGEQDRRRPLIKLAATAGSAVKLGMEQEGRAQDHTACKRCC